MKSKSPHSLLTPEQKTSAIEEIIRFFETEREETIGVIAAEEVLDLFLETMGKEIYNNAISNSVKFVKSRLEGLDFEMETSLKK